MPADAASDVAELQHEDGSTTVVLPTLGQHCSGPDKSLNKPPLDPLEGPPVSSPRWRVAGVNGVKLPPRMEAKIAELGVEGRTGPCPLMRYAEQLEEPPRCSPKDCVSRHTAKLPLLASPPAGWPS